MTPSDDDVFDIHIRLRLWVPEEARVAQAVSDAGTRKRKDFICSCILRALDSSDPRTAEDSIRELERRVRFLEQICAQGTEIRRNTETSARSVPEIPAGILKQMKKYSSG